MRETKLAGHLVRAITMGLAFGAFHCVNKPAEPVMPTWDINLAAPVANRTYTLGEIVAKDPDLLQVFPGSTQIYLKTSVQAEPTYVGDRIMLEPIQTSFYSELGPFSVTSGEMRFNLQIPGYTPGATMIVPPAVPVDIPPVSGDVPNIQYMLLESGEVVLSLWNRMPVPLRVESPISLENESGGSIAVFEFGTTPIDPGETRTVLTSVAGKTVYQRVRLGNITVSSPGSGTSMVTIPDTMLTARITPTNLVANDAIVTNISSHHFVESRDLPMTSGTLVRELWLQRGSLHLRFASNVNLQTSLRLRLPELFRPTGQAFDQVFAIAPHDSFDLIIDLSRHQLHSLNGDFLRGLRAECDADLIGAEGQPVAVHASDHISVQVSTSDIYADSAVAALQPTVIAIDERVGLNLGELSRKFRGNLNIPAADMVFTPRTNIVMPMELNVRFEALTGTGNTVTLQVPVTKGTAGLEAVTFAPGDVGTFLSSVSGSLPDSLRVVGSITLNPDFDTLTASHVGRNCSFAGDMDLSIPMSLRIADGHFADTLTMGDTTGDGSSDRRIDESTLNDVNYGQLHVVIDNGLPLDLKIKIGLLDRARNMVLAVPQSEGDSIAIAAGSVLNGDVQASSRSTRTIELQGAEVRQFNLADLVKVDLGLATGGSMPVNFRTTDQVRVRIWTQLSYRVNP